MAGSIDIVTVYDVAVIGAGVIGSAAAYQIAKTGTKVVLLEQVQSSAWRYMIISMIIMHIV